MREHRWRTLTRKEFHPASSGRVCIHCHLVDLGWSDALRPLGIDPLPACTDPDIPIAVEQMLKRIRANE